MKCLKSPSSYEETIKGSRFLSELFPCESQSQARDLVKAQKNKYPDATHVVHAFVIGPAAEILGMSDDGEPSGTAGRPTLDVLKGFGCTNILVTITRWFGGTLLGTGGLVRAYSTSVKDALAKCEMSEIFDGVKLELKTDYTSLAQVQNLMRNLNIQELESTYENDVNLVLISPENTLAKFKKELAELFSGREITTEIGKVRYGKNGQDIFVL